MLRQYRLVRVLHKDLRSRKQMQLLAWEVHDEAKDTKGRRVVVKMQEALRVGTMG